MSTDTINVLFVCKDNSIRSIFAQALLNRFAGKRFCAFSCGLHPAANFHPRAVAMLSEHGLPLDNRSTRDISDFLDPSAPRIDIVINLSGEPVPQLPGNPFHARWGIADPLAGEGDPAREAMAFRRTFRELETRVSLFVLLRHPSREHQPSAQPQVA